MSKALEQIAAIRGFAWAGEAERSDEPTGAALLDVDGNEVGWAVCGTLEQDPFTLFDAIEKMSGKERTATLEEQERMERELIIEFLSTAGDAERLWLAEDEETAEHEALLELCAPESAVSHEEIGVAVSALTRETRAVIGRCIAHACGHSVSFSTAAAAALAARLLESREAVFRDSLRLAVSVAKKHNYGLKWDLAVAAASSGLVRAIDRFDPSKGFQFSTYAQWWIRHAVGRARQNHHAILRIPVHAGNAMGRYRRAERELWQWGNSRPSASVVTDEVAGMSPRHLAILRRPARTAVHASDIGSGPAEQVLDPFFPSPAEGGLVEGWPLAAGERLRGWFAEVGGGKRPDERVPRILNARVRRRGEEYGTLKSVGEEFGVSRERIRQLEEAAIARLHVLMQYGPGFDPMTWGLGGADE